MDYPPREARLKPAFSHIYPPITPGVWHLASEVGARMLVWQLQQPGPVALGSRVLANEHYEFRGGVARGKVALLRTRADDPEPEPAA